MFYLETLFMRSFRFDMQVTKYNKLGIGVILYRVVDQTQADQ